MGCAFERRVLIIECDAADDPLLLDFSTSLHSFSLDIFSLSLRTSSSSASYCLHCIFNRIRKYTSTRETYIYVDGAEIEAVSSYWRNNMSAPSQRRPRMHVRSKELQDAILVWDVQQHGCCVLVPCDSHEYTMYPGDWINSMDDQWCFTLQEEMGTSASI